MSPLSSSDVAYLLDECTRLLREREQIGSILADLPESVTALRWALNRLHRMVGGLPERPG